jgi:hypothetical protein
VRPHAKDTDGPFLFEHLVDQPVLDVDATGVGPLEIAHEAFVRRGPLKGIVLQNEKKFLHPLS